VTKQIGLLLPQGERWS